jgi:hypothetical protein
LGGRQRIGTAILQLITAVESHLTAVRTGPQEKKRKKEVEEKHYCITQYLIICNANEE